MSTTKERKITVKDFKSSQKSTWCPGCGDFGILSSIQTALINMDIAPWETMLVAGIGCGSKLPDYINANGFMTLHGRGVTIACGAHMANTNLKVIAIGGDGDGFGIGIGHAIHNMRRNMDIVQIVENNEVYGLTKGQYSPTSKQGFKTSTSPEGAIEFAINPGLLALAGGATFIGYAYSGDPRYTASIIQKALEHKGYALVNVLQTCPSYNKLQTNDWFKEKMFKIDEAIPNYDPTDVTQVHSLLAGTHEIWTQESFENKLYPQGVLYVNNNRPTYMEQVPAMQNNPLPLVEHDLTIDQSTLEKIKKSYV